MSVMYTCTSVIDMCCKSNSSFRLVSYHTAHARRKMSCFAFLLFFWFLLSSLTVLSFCVPSCSFWCHSFWFNRVSLPFLVYCGFLFAFLIWFLHVPFLMSVIFKENNSSLLRASHPRNSKVDSLGSWWLRYNHWKHLFKKRWIHPPNGKKRCI